MTGAEGRPDAVVFDCDGTLVDTERISDAALHDLLPDYGKDVTDADLRAIRGRPWPDTWSRFRDRVPVTEETFHRAFRDRFGAIFDARARFFDDAVATVEALHADGVRLAVCTSSSRRHLERVLDLGLRDRFAVTVAAEDTTEHKPTPAPYLLAARLLDVDPYRCGAAEDSPVGVAAASAAGMWTVGVVRPGHDADDLGGADAVVDALDPALFDGSWPRTPR